MSVDNSTSPVHSLLRVSCRNRKGLLYDCLRIVKDFKLKVAHGQLPDVDSKGNTKLCLFLLNSHDHKISHDQVTALVQRIEEEIADPVRMKVGRSGNQIQLLVATPIASSSGKGRPGVANDVTQALNNLGISIFMVNLRHLPLVENSKKGTAVMT